MHCTESANSSTEFINCVIRATELTFELMLGCSVARRNLAHFERGVQTYSLSALVRIRGAAEGYIGLSFSQETAEEITRRLLGDEEPRTSTLAYSAVKELCNVIAGTTNTLSGRELETALPEIYSSLYSQQFMHPCTPMSAEFDSEVGAFVIVFALAYTGKSSPSRFHIIRGRPQRIRHIERRLIRSCVDGG